MKLCPRRTLRRVIQSHLPADVRLASKNVDVLIYLAYLVFLQELADESRLRMQMDGAAGRQLLRRHVMVSGRAVLQKRGERP